MRDHRDPAGLVDQLHGLLGGRPLAGDERLRARDEVLLEERTQVGTGAGGLGDVGRPIASAAPALATASSKVTSTPWPLSFAMISLARSTRSCWALSQAGGSAPGRPSNRRCGGPRSTRARTTSRPRARSRSRPRSAAAVASATPAMPSWSVSAITVTPASAAERATSAGSSWPSETIECDCRSIIGARDGSAGAWPTNRFLSRVATIGRCESQRRPTTPCARRSSSPRSPDGTPIKGERLAESQGIPLQFLEHILLELKHARLIQARRGARGGYWLARDPSEITIADVIRAVEGPLANIHENAPEELHYAGPPSACETSGSPCAPRCARCSRTPPWPRSAAAICHGASRRSSTIPKPG